MKRVPYKFKVQATDSKGRLGTHRGRVDAYTEDIAREAVIEAVQAAGYQPCTPVTLKRK
ncbi:hypothetical protein ACIGG5_29590 [Streptomyces sp. NPDC085463]|uniref:hypothetical protein n=1 Tax=Streptomyces sp. NPDC085463 TaxID=3365724 RepID=UPI0037CF3AC0